jgi:hypothetical protein
MTTPTLEQQRAWMAQWRAAGPALARVRADEIRETDLSLMIMSLGDAYRAARAVPSSVAESGLVEQQRLFHGRRST